DGAGEEGEGEGGEEDAGAGDDGFDEALLSRASEAGLSEEEARGYGSPEALKHGLSVLEKLAGKAADLSREQETGEDEDAFDIELDEELIDPDVVKTFQGMKSHFEGVVGKLQGRIGELEEQLGEQVMASRLDRVDRTLDGMGEEYAELFGRGPRAGLGEAEIANRQQVLETIDTLRSGYAQQGKTIPSDAELVKRAVQSEFGDKLQEITRKQLAQRTERRRRQALSRGSSREGKALSPEEQAIRFAENFARERDMGDDDEL
ncbi:MAG: hypothetical protein ACOCTI_08930, partial [Phycisphaeraceae bacterium]